jgi:adenylate cyclase
MSRDGGEVSGAVGKHSAPLQGRQVGERKLRPLAMAALVVALCLPLVGLLSLLQIDYEHWHWTNPPFHFVLFLAVGATAASLSLVTAEAARRRGDARVLLLSLGFLSTSGFMALHAIGTADVLVEESLPGFTIAISAGLLLAAVFAVMAALVDVSPTLGPLVMRARPWLYAFVFASLAVWAVWTWANLPPLDTALGEGGAGTALEVAAALGAAIYVVAAARLWWGHRRRPSMLVLSVGACFVLLAEALVGVAFAGEMKWHSAWWEWHALIVVGYLIVFAAAHREWRDERFRELYLPTTREHREEVTVLIGDLAGFTTFAESNDPAEVAAMLRAYYEVAAPLISRRFGGEVEKFMGDGIFATFNRRGDQPDHATRAVLAADALQEEVEAIRADNAGWPGLRIGINSGPVVVTEMGGAGYVVYPAVGDPVNIAARLQAEAPVGGVLIGDETRRRLPPETELTPVPGLRVKGKDSPVDAYVLLSTGELRERVLSRPRGRGR